MNRRHALAALALSGCVLALAGCGSGTRSQPAARGDEGTIRMTMAGIGDLDPVLSNSPQDTEIDWLVYTGLVTYPHARGRAGTALIPGVAAQLPRISDGGRTYTVTLRSGLSFSDGRPLRAIDVEATLQRVVRTPYSPVRALLLPVLQGAAAYATGRAASISGVSADDASGEVTIRLTRRDPAFDAVLAQPGLGIVPAGTPLRLRADDPPPGIGPYRLARVVPGRSFVLARNPRWVPLSGVPAGHLDIDVSLTADTAAAAQAVLNDVIDVDDSGGPIPSSVLSGIRHDRTGRFATAQNAGPTAYVFLGGVAPLDERVVRTALATELSNETDVLISGGAVVEGCDVVPATLGGAVPIGCPQSAPIGVDLAAARLLVARSGTFGQTLTVWAPRDSASDRWVSAEVGVLSELGYEVRVSTLPTATYRSEILGLVPRSASSTSGHAPPRALDGRVSTKLAGDHGAATNPAKGGVSDSDSLSVVDVFALGAGSDTLAQDLSRHAYLLTIGGSRMSELMSARVNEAAAIVNPVEGLDLSSLQLAP